MKTVQEIMRENDTDRKIADFRAKQKQDYSFKRQYAEIRAWEFFDHPEIAGNAYCAIGGLDSITLFLFLRSIGIDVPGVSVSFLEDVSIQRVHKALGIHRLSAAKKKDGTPWTKPEVVKCFGWPILSKEIAGKIDLLQHPSDDNKTVRHAIITGETGEYGGWKKDSRMRLSQKWLDIFGGADAEGAAMGYKTAPFAIFDRDDLLRLTLEMDAWYHDHWQEFSDHHIESIIPAVYGKIEAGSDGKLITTGAQRTGCSVCCFGLHLEKRPHRFDKLYQTNPKEWDFWMRTMGLSAVLDYIGIEWQPQITMFNLDGSIREDK